MIGLHGPDDSFRSRDGAYALTRAQLERLEISTGIPVSRWEETTPSRFANELLPSRTKPGSNLNRIRDQVSLTTTKICRHCLGEGAWMGIWQVKWMVACPIHECLLESTCSACELPHRASRVDKWPRDPNGFERNYLACWNRLDGLLCRASLIDSSEVERIDDAPLLRAQSELIKVLCGDGSPSIAGLPVQSSEYFADLSMMLSLVRQLRWRGDETSYQRLGVGKPGTTGQPVMRFAGDIARYLPEAHRTLAGDDSKALTDWLRNAGDQLYATSRKRLPPAARYPNLSLTLKASLEEARATSSYTNSGARMGIDPRRHRRPASIAENVGARHVPQLFWEEEFGRHLAPHFDGLGVSKFRARRLCSVLLVRVLEPNDWAEADELLGFQQRNVGQSHGVLLSNIRSNGKAEALQADIVEIFNRRTLGLNPVDFSALRKTLSNWDGFDPHTWAYIKPGFNPSLVPRGDSRRQRDFASAVTWSIATSGDPMCAPIELPGGRYQLTLFARRHLAKYRQRLEIYAQFLRQNPTSSQEFLRGLLIGELVARGAIAPRITGMRVTEEALARVLKVVEREVGVSRSLILSGDQKSSSVEARALASCLLGRVSGCGPGAVGEALGCSRNWVSARKANFAESFRINPALKRLHEACLNRSVRESQISIASTDTSS